MFKARLTTIIGALVFQTGAMAQIYVKAPGDVGIGINTPATKLHVNGDITAGTAGGGYHLIVNDIPTARWALGTGGYGFHIANDYASTTTWQDKFVINHEGNVGIGVAQPTARLTLPNMGSASLRVGVNSNMANTHTQLINSLAVLADDRYTTSSLGAVAWDFFNNGNNPSWAGALLQYSGPDVAGSRNGVSASNQAALVFQNAASGVIASNGATIMIAPRHNILATFTVDEKVGIGTTNPQQKLDVNGNVRAHSMIAYNGSAWPDYVFESSYQLPSLSEIKNYINQHHHLPDVPSAEDVKKDGVNLGENQAILLKKVEELTLYVIEQNEKLTALTAENAELKEAIKEIKTNSKRKRK